MQYTMVYGKPDPLAAPSALFASLHPALAKLEAAMANLQTNNGLVDQQAKWVAELAQKVDPTKWSAQIEGARENPDELASIRVQYNEEALTFLSAFLRYSITSRATFDGRTAICDAIAEAMAVADKLGRSNTLQGVIQARLLLAAKIHRHDDSKRFDHHSLDRDVQRARGIQVAAFKLLAEQLGKLQTWAKYPTDLVVAGHKHKRHLNRDVDLRSVFGVPFVADASKYPASAKLAVLIEECEATLRQCWEAEKLIKGDQNGRINERQHASRLIDFLNHEGPDAAYRCGGTLDQQIEAQNQRRLDYEMNRQILIVNIERLKSLLDQTLTTLREAVAEASVVLEAMGKERHNTVDVIEMSQVMLNNCLAADAQLRRWSQHLEGLQVTATNDLSRQAGSLAVDQAYKEHVVNNYGYLLNRRRMETATDRDTTRQA